MSVGDLLNVALSKDVDFAAYRFPGEENINVLVDKGKARIIDSLEDISTLEGFIFAPFDSQQHKSLLIRPGYRFSGKIGDLPAVDDWLSEQPERNTETQADSDVYTAKKSEYTKGVEYIKKNIRLGLIKKAVLTRIYNEALPAGFNAAELFLNLCKAYKHSFISLVFTATTGCWVSATPEMLIRSDADGVTLISLAGTRFANSDVNNVHWSQKELTEQQIVTDYITQVLEHNHFNNYHTSGPETVKAGRLYHLKTTISVPNLSLNGKTSKFIKELHPTPAVWGQPKDAVKDIIQQTEKHNREYYSGFLGPVNIHNKIDLYVNIRTLKVTNNRLNIL
ncbi:MAG: hypothetical protein HC896_14955 [Bacteroidales bacterium]|nr:hypothetical protein [Bacteroidales bacterium]